MSTLTNKALRRKIVEMVVAAGEGHIPSAFSILDMVSFLYADILRVDPNDPENPDRDYFILSKGHGCLALYTVLHREGFLTDADLTGFCQKGGILGGHPDMTKVPGAEASSGSLGHGLPFALGIALGDRVQGRSNRHIVLVGDGECHEGTVWESAHLAANLQLGSLCVLVDANQSGMQLLPRDDLAAKWRAFGWEVKDADGHDATSLKAALEGAAHESTGRPRAIIARTVKGKGVSMMEGHGPWHHRTPNAEELRTIMEALA